MRAASAPRRKRIHMVQSTETDWHRRVVTPEKALSKIEPGMCIFLGSGVAEPRTLMHGLIRSDLRNLQDLEIIQLVGFGEAVTPEGLACGKYRYKTFFSGWGAGPAVVSGQVDLIPCRFSAIPRRIQSGRVHIDTAFVQISPPDETGYSCLGAVVDGAKSALEKATLKIGEINEKVPFTSGGTRIRISDFDWLVNAAFAPYTFDRWQVRPVHDRIAAHIASVIPDGCCIAFSFGPLFTALARQLAGRRDLGIHSPFFTDDMMDLVKNGTVTNCNKLTHPGKSVASYAVGTPELMRWLHRNPEVEFHGIETVFNPAEIGRNPNLVSVQLADRVDLSGSVFLPAAGGTVAPGPEEVLDFINGAELSAGGLTLFVLPSRNKAGRSNFIGNPEHPNAVSGFRESVDVIATEYGVAGLRGRTLRERAQALIDIAHPEDRPALFELAIADRLLYPDQAYPAACPIVDTPDVHLRQMFKGGVDIRFRPIKPSDEEEMRRLFYRFSDEAVYYRYFSRIKTMPHQQMQDYVNIDCNTTLSIVGVAGSAEEERIVAEARYVGEISSSTADIAFVVDDDYQGIGIGSFLFKLIADSARTNGIKTFTADVLATNKGMMTVFERGQWPLTARLSSGVYTLKIALNQTPTTDVNPYG